MAVYKGIAKLTGRITRLVPRGNVRIVYGVHLALPVALLYNANGIYFRHHLGIEEVQLHRRYPCIGVRRWRGL